MGRKKKDRAEKGHAGKKTPKGRDGGEKGPGKGKGGKKGKKTGQAKTAAGTHGKKERRDMVKIPIEVIEGGDTASCTVEEPIAGLAIAEGTDIPAHAASREAAGGAETGVQKAAVRTARTVVSDRDAYRDELTHVDEKGDVRMVDVGDKAVTKRTAVAEGTILMHPETQAMVLEDRAKKGDVLACARVAGIMAAKRTSDLIPMCHPLPLTKAKVDIEPVMHGDRPDGRVGFRVTATTGVTGVTGIEMEALTAANVACLTIYDMCKAVDRGMEITDVRLLLKEGGRSGLWERKS